ncbi:hypothetical protein WDU94_003053 [Cyamophila willieti]
MMLILERRIISFCCILLLSRITYSKRILKAANHTKNRTQSKLCKDAVQDEETKHRAQNKLGKGVEGTKNRAQNKLIKDVEGTKNRAQNKLGKEKRKTRARLKRKKSIVKDKEEDDYFQPTVKYTKEEEEMRNKHYEKLKQGVVKEEHMKNFTGDCNVYDFNAKVHHNPNNTEFDMDYLGIPKSLIDMRPAGPEGDSFIDKMPFLERMPFEFWHFWEKYPEYVGKNDTDYYYPDY